MANVTVTIPPRFVSGAGTQAPYQQLGSNGIGGFWSGGLFWPAGAPTTRDVPDSAVSDLQHDAALGLIALAVN